MTYIVSGGALNSTHSLLRKYVTCTITEDSFKKPDNEDIDMKSLTLLNVQYCIVCSYAVCNLFFSIFVYFLQIQIV